MRQFAIISQGFAVLILLALAGCQTPTDRWLSDHLSAREKSGLMVDKSLETFSRLVDTDDLALVPSLRSLIQLAVATDPTDARASDALKKLDAYLTKHRNESQARVKVLTDKPTLSDKEKYTLVVLVRQLQLLAAPGVDLSQLATQTAPIRAEVLKMQTQAVADAEKAVVNAKTEQAVAKALAGVSKAVAELKQVDPASTQATEAASWLTADLTKRAKTYLETAKKAWVSKDYTAADRALDKIDQVLAGAGYQPTGEVDDMRYGLALDWARALFADKKYAEASSRINDALTVQVTPEALDLRDKIVQAASVRDWDSEYDGVDKQLDALVKSGDLKTAWNLVNGTGPRLKKDDTKARLAIRKKQVLDAAHDAYEAAVTAYNNEDYGDAKAGFDQVAAIDPTWKLTKAYQDKARARQQLLEGH